MPKDPQDEVKLGAGGRLSGPDRSSADMPVLSAGEDFGSGEPSASAEGQRNAPVESPASAELAPDAPRPRIVGLGIVLALIVLGAALAVGWYFLLR